ncbi:GIY-YIG nuclease family protein [Draconibacterium halophilum]|uniref:GIY-YIG nuclease family protein n=1 Tax=Draconibacterium halophilum TaxID=2706887 RepID=A0A6C0REC2_9BACT|nr:GIY-YIG nuclease family protein [Draconibacterium halophilum]
MKHYVYILQSLKDGKYYIGYTTDVDKRICYHNSGKQRSTKSRIPFRIIYTEEFATRQLALKREKKIKSYKGGNAFKRLISG